MPDFKAKMHQNPKFGWVSASDTLEELIALPKPLAEFKGPTSKERGGEGMGGECCGVQKILKIDPGHWTDSIGKTILCCACIAC